MNASPPRLASLDVLRGCTGAAMLPVIAGCAGSERMQILLPLLGRASL